MKLYFSIAIIFSLLVCRVASAQFLVEVLRNTDCANCKVPDAQYEALLAQHPEYQVQIVYIHNNFPSPADPFYLISKADVNARVGSAFYQVAVDPNAFINGSSGASSFSTWKNLTEQTASTLHYSASLSITAFIDGSNKLHVDLHADGTTSGKQVKPYVMLVESGLKYNNTQSYGNPTDGNWNNIFRAMIPGSTGGDAVTLSGPQDFHYVYDPTTKPWILQNCKIVAFLQEVTAQSDNISRNIDALAIAPITSSGVAEKKSQATSLSAPIPNPSQSFAKIPFHLAAPANVKIVICDDLGREVSTIINGFVSETESSAVFYPNNISKGMYYARMYADGNFIGMQKIVFAP